MKKYSTCTRSCSCTLYRCTFVPSYNVVHLFGGNRFANGDMIASGVLQRTVRVHVHVYSSTAKKYQFNSSTVRVSCLRVHVHVQ